MTMNPHAELDLLSSYLDGELDASERARLDGHLPTCAECRSTLTALQATIADLAALPEVAPTPQDSWALRAAIRRARSPMRKWQRLSWAAGAVAAAAIAVFAFTLPGNDGGRDLAATSADQLESAVPIYQSGQNLTPVDAQSRLIALASGQAGAIGTPVPGSAPMYDSGDRNSKETLSGGSATIPTPQALTFSAVQATSDERAAIERCVQIVRSSTQGFLEPIRYELAAFESKPAYLLFFRSADRYELWVVARQNCRDILYFSQYASPAG
jgi:anti-sigma factor RsiW